MTDEYFYNADGELLFVPQQGALRLCTEFGIIDIAPGEIAVIPRGVKLRVELPGRRPAATCARTTAARFTLPERGPIGANCLANPRDFLTPVAAYEDRDAPGPLIVKWGGALWQTELDHSPLDVVAWHGNYAPYKYDLRRFSPVGPLLFDHADPRIFTVLTSPQRDAGHRQHRLRHLPRSLARGRGHVPPALVPHERHERVHGPDLRPVRRQDRRRLRARRLLAAQHHAAARAGHRRVRARQHRRARAAQAGGHDGLHVRDALPAARHRLRRRRRRSCRPDYDRPTARPYASISRRSAAEPILRRIACNAKPLSTRGAQ